MAREKIYEFVWSEIPNPVIDKELYELVVKNMVPEPCVGVEDRRPCIVNGKDSKDYPISFCHHISFTTGPDESVQYGRISEENEVRTAMKGNVQITNKVIVPHNP